MLECRGVVKELPQAKEGWQVKLAAGSQIPYIVDGENGQKRWCMEIFQAQVAGSSARPIDEAPELNLDNVVASDTAPGSQTSAPVAPMKGVSQGILGYIKSDIKFLGFLFVQDSNCL